MEGNVFWLRLWQSAAVAVVLVAMTAGGCTIHNTTAIERMVQAGADPQKASCAVRGDDSRTGVCVLIASGK